MSSTDAPSDASVGRWRWTRGRELGAALSTMDAVAARSQRVRGDKAVDGRRGDAAAPAHGGDSRRLMVDALIGEEHGEAGHQLAKAMGFPP